MEKLRGFEVAAGWEDKNINLPIRSTTKSAGYDIEAAEDVKIEPFKMGDKPTIVHTGLKAYFQDDEWLMLANRSSGPIKKKIVLANGIGIVDADYYGNISNDGELMFQFYNMDEVPVEIKKGDKIGQAVFQKFLCATDESVTDKIRDGYFGSTGK